MNEEKKDDRSTLDSHANSGQQQLSVSSTRHERLSCHETWKAHDVDSLSQFNFDGMKNSLDAATRTLPSDKTATLPKRTCAPMPEILVFPSFRDQPKREQRDPKTMGYSPILSPRGMIPDGPFPPSHISHDEHPVPTAYEHADMHTFDDSDSKIKSNRFGTEKHSVPTAYEHADIHAFDDTGSKIKKNQFDTEKHRSVRPTNGAEFNFCGTRGAALHGSSIVETFAQHTTRAQDKAHGAEMPSLRLLPEVRQTRYTTNTTARGRGIRSEGCLPRSRRREETHRGSLAADRPSSVRGRQRELHGTTGSRNNPFIGITKFLQER